MKDNKDLILKRLAVEYAGTGTALTYRNPFELLIAVILSAQSTDQQVNKVTEPLFARYPTPEAIAELTEEELTMEIKGVGLFRNKAKNILATAKILVEQYDSQVPQDRESLLTLPGVGRKTANVVLANAFGIPAFGVDTHVLRVSNRLGLAEGNNPLRVEEQLTRLLPQDKWAEAHHWLIWHGREVCQARKPKCTQCFLLDLCPYPKEE
ncbi:MAG: endonuclease III [Peptococcia bacterium]